MAWLSTPALLGPVLGQRAPGFMHRGQVATMHQRLANLYAHYLPLRILPPPVELPAMREYMAWHRSLDRDPMLRWLREKLVHMTQGPDSTITF